MDHHKKLRSTQNALALKKMKEENGNPKTSLGSPLYRKGKGARNDKK